MSNINLLTKPVIEPSYAMPSFGARPQVRTADVRRRKGDLSVTGFAGRFGDARGDARTRAVRTLEPDH